jgi:hypothetical protein
MSASNERPGSEATTADVVVVGAGWSGLTAAARLASSGRSVVVVEKARGPGGRSATRRHEGYVFDHGAQYLTTRTDAFLEQVQSWSRAGLLATWRPELAVFGDRPADAGVAPTERWVGVGGMNAVLRRLAEGLECRWRWRAENLSYSAGRWRVASDAGASLSTRALLLTAPPAQSASLLGAEHPLSARMTGVDMLPCWALMAGFETAPPVDFEAAFVNAGPLSWVARNDTKPAQGKANAWVAHATPEWSLEHLESSPRTVAPLLLEALRELDPGFGSEPDVHVAHRWRYAMSRSALEGPILADDSQKLVVAGDWCAGERVEGAWVSGVAASRRLESLL